ncbi:MAG: copper-binding protein [Phycisphaerales bacterium]
MFARIARLAAPVLLGAAFFACAGCGGAESADDAPAGDLVRYTVRGEVVALPSPDNPASEMQIRHEPIPDFRSGGEVVGMRAMTMPFPVGEGVSLEDIAIGDKVEVAFETRYSPDTRMVSSYEIVSITELPADTELVFDQPAPDSDG